MAARRRTRTSPNYDGEQLWFDYVTLFMRALEGAWESDCRQALAILEDGKARRAGLPRSGLRLISSNAAREKGGA